MMTVKKVGKANALVNQSIIVFSHLRWEFVLQRPQHIISRLARDNRILFVEEPIEYGAENYRSANWIKVNENLTVVQPRIDWNEMISFVPRLVEKWARTENEFVVWYYSPSFLEIGKRLNSKLVVFDCMDQLSAFKGASPTLIEQERELLGIADVVFTGGKSLYEEKSKYHDFVHCFPSSVEQKHFAKAISRSTRIPEDLAKIPEPRVGFYGVIDERIDLKLLEETAMAMPKVNFVMIGPVVKIEEKELPRLENIYYLGSKSYKDLPNYLKGINVAFMPFALNESTKFISPTKTLEFMAAGKPVISTPIVDVVRDYKSVVEIVGNAEEMKKAISKLLKMTKTEEKKRENDYRTILSKTSWDNTVTKMRALMAEALLKNKEEERNRRRRGIYKEKVSVSI